MPTKKPTRKPTYDKLLLLTSSSDENYSGGVLAAYVELTPATVKRLLEVYKLYKTAKRMADDLWEIRLWGDFAGIYLSAETLEANGVDAFKVEQEEVVKCRKSFAYEQGEAMAYRLTIATSDGIRLHAAIKHTSVEMTSAYISWDTLRDAAKKFKGGQS